MVNKARRMESLLELIEENRLLKEAAKVSQGFDPHKALSNEDILAELGIDKKEIDALEDSVVIE